MKKAEFILTGLLAITGSQKASADELSAAQSDPAPVSEVAQDVNARAQGCVDESHMECMDYTVDGVRNYVVNARAGIFGSSSLNFTEQNHLLMLLEDITRALIFNSPDLGLFLDRFRYAVQSICNQHDATIIHGPMPVIGAHRVYEDTCDKTN